MAQGDTTQLATGSNTTGAANVTFASATAGNLLKFDVGRAATNSGAWDAITGWTAGPQSVPTVGNIAGATWWKIAAGGETSVTTGGTNEVGNWNATVTEIEGPFEAVPLDVSAENEDNIAGVVTSQTSGTTGTLAAATAIALAMFAADNGANVTDGRAYTNDFTEAGFATSGARASVCVAKKLLSATTGVETTFSTTDIGDEMYGSVMVFKFPAAAGNGTPPPGMLRPMGIIF